ncbi:RNA polymerase sigma-70 factor [Halalkalibaculum sp. DA3122]|uniref:RNA polymerase sigma-70 factor n=1 Tax=Halalkalibaculum sp. DA3122 TaxID=3373607 RepID=UPI003754DA97
MEKPTAEQIQIWAKRISESDQEAFNRFFRSMYPRLIHFAMRYTRRKTVASDIVQDAFVKLWEKRRNIDPGQSIKAYIYRTVRNKALNYIRDHSDETVGLEVLNDTPADTETEIQLNDRSEQLWELLKQWIEELPDRQREAFKLSRFDGLDHEEIAGVMNISSNTVNNHIVAALDNLRSRCDLYQQEVNEA